MSKFILKVINGTILKPGTEFILTQGANTFGRKEGDNKIVIPEKGISRSHCNIEVLNNGELHILDNNSGNGTFVNHKKISAKTKLKNKDKIKIGDNLFELIIQNKSNSAQTSSKSTSQKEKNIKTSEKDTSTKKKPFSGKYIVIAILIIFGIATIFFKPSNKKSSPSMRKCSKLYTWAEMGCSFKHPPRWKRKVKYKKDVFGYTFFERSVLVFGYKYKTHNIDLIVDVLDGVPDIVDLSALTDPKGKQFPRNLSFKGKHTSIEKIKISGKDAFICESPVIQKREKELKTIEAVIKDHNRRFLIIGIAPKEIFNDFKPLLRHMIESFTLIPFKRKLNKPDNVRAEVKRILQSATALADKRHIKTDNLYEALQKFKEGAMLLNIYDFKEKDTLRQKLLIQYKSATKLLNDQIRELKFEIKRGKKVREYSAIIKACNKILSLLPDEDDKTYQYAKKTRSKYIKK